MFERPLFMSIVGSSSDLWPDDDDDEDDGSCMFLPHIEQGQGMAPIACGLWVWPDSLLAADVTKGAGFAARFFRRCPSFLFSLHLRFHASISIFHVAASCNKVRPMLAPDFETADSAWDSAWESDHQHRALLRQYSPHCRPCTGCGLCCR